MATHNKYMWQATKMAVLTRKMILLMSLVLIEFLFDLLGFDKY